MTPRTRLGLIIGFVVLAAIAVAGWFRSSSPTTSAYQTNPPTPGVVNPPPAGPTAYDQYGQSAASSLPQYPGTVPVAYGAPPAVLPEFACPRYVRTVRQPEPEAPAASYGEADRAYPEYVTPVAPRYVDRRAEERREIERHEDRHHHSGRRTAEIVAGSAGIGAAIGAIAGGGKGAGIGALAGGGGGFIYDRLSRNR